VLGRGAAGGCGTPTVRPVTTDLATDAPTGFDISRVRALFPALDSGTAFLDGAAGTQTPRSVIQAIGDAYAGGLSNSGGAFTASRRSDAIVAAARQAVADLVGGVPDGVVFGPSSTALTYRFAAPISTSWEPGDNIVLSRLDHDADVRPWVQAAERAGAQVRWLEPSRPSLELQVEQAALVIDSRTRLVAVTAASNVVGTRPDLSPITALAHGVGALTWVDGVHATPHTPVDVVRWGADFYATSAYKWCGPHVAAVVAAPVLLETLHPDKLASSTDAVPDRFELGTLPFADLAGVTAAVDHMASFEDLAAGGPREVVPGVPVLRREKLRSSMAAVEAYESDLFARLLDGLARMPRVRTIGSAASRTPTAWFTVAGHSPSEVSAAAAAADVAVWDGHNYAWELAGVLGIRESGSAVRASVVHYTDADDVDRLLEVLHTISR